MSTVGNDNPDLEAQEERNFHERLGLGMQFVGVVLSICSLAATIMIMVGQTKIKEHPDLIALIFMSVVCVVVICQMFFVFWLNSRH